MRDHSGVLSCERTRLHVRLRVLAGLVELEAAHVDALEPLDQLLDVGLVRLLAGEELPGQLQEVGVERDVDGFFGFGGQAVDVERDFEVLRAQTSAQQRSTAGVFS